MKLLNKILIGAGMLAAFSFTSCEDGLTTPTQSSFDESIVFSTPTLAEYNILGIYNVFGEQNSHRGRYLPWYGFNTDIEMYTSSALDGSKADIAQYHCLPDNQQMNGEKNPYADLFTGVERANICVTAIKKYGNIETNKEMAALYGEALTARALMYTELLKAYGEVPARFAPLTSDTMYAPKADRDVIFKQVLSDLEEAAQYMVWPNANTATSTTARPSKAFALGLYARLALMASGSALRPDEGQVGTGNQGTVRTSNDPDLQKEVLYPKALAALKDVIDNAGLSLYKDYEQLWRDFNNNDITAGKEIIYSIPFSDKRGRWNYTFAIRHDGSTKYIGSKTNMGGAAGPNPTLYWKYPEGDQRRDVSCVNFKVMKGADNIERQVLAGINNWYFGKFRFEWMEANPYTGGNDDGIKPVYMRYPDILLMAAEIANDPACGNRDEDFAKKCLLEVRKRAMKDDPAAAEAYVKGLSGQDAIFKAIVDERALEFVGEFLRKSDLIRWGMLKTKLDDAKKDLQNFYERKGDYADFGPSVWYRYAADGFTLETYGLNEPATKNSSPGEDWTLESETYIKYGDDQIEKVNSFYYNNPDEKQWWPIPAYIINTSLGSLVNDYGY